MAENNNNSRINECPVCHAKLDQSVCSECGWVHIVFPTVLPKAINDFNSRRTNICADIVARRKKEVLDSERKLRKMADAHADIQNKLKQKEMEELTLRRDISALESDLHKKDSENNILANKTDSLSLDLQVKEKEVDTLKCTINTLQTTVDTTSRRLLDMERQYKQRISELQNSSKGQDVKGIVCIKKLGMTEVPCYIPIYEGRNTYGTASDDGLQHKIKMRIRGINVLDRHFAVATYKERLVLFDLSNGSLTCNGLTIPANGIYVDEKAMILLDNILEIRISKL